MSSIPDSQLSFVSLVQTQPLSCGGLVSGGRARFGFVSLDGLHHPLLPLLRRVVSDPLQSHDAAPIYNPILRDAKYLKRILHIAVSRKHDEIELVFLQKWLEEPGVFIHVQCQELNVGATHVLFDEFL
jgi:hypothetical protein